MRGILTGDPPQPTMAAGGNGCLRCGGWVVEFQDLIDQDNLALTSLRCLLCGTRKFRETVSSDDWKEAIWAKRSAYPTTTKKGESP